MKPLDIIRIFGVGGNLDRSEKETPPVRDLEVTLDSIPYVAMV